MQPVATTTWAVVAAFATFTVVAAAQGPAPVAGAAAQASAPGRGAGAGRGGRGGGRGPTMKPSELRSIPAETLAAKYKDPNWRGPRLAWGHPDLEGTWTSDDMRGVPQQRPKEAMDRESLTPEEFARRAGGDEASRDRAVNQETFLRNEFGVRTFGYTSVVVDPRNGQMPAITPQAAARRKAQAGVGTFGNRPLNSFEDFTLYDRCITRGVGGITPVLYGNGLLIAQTPNEVVISYEMIHDTRVIPLNRDKPRLDPKIKLWMGDSRGWFEGETLVVETTNFTDRTSIGGLHSDRLRLTERFTRIDPEMIDYRMTVEDPETWVAPFTLRYTITQQPNYQLYEYSCHEGNTALSVGLSSERAVDREEAEAKAKGIPYTRALRNNDVYAGTTQRPRDVNSSK